jgi:hypothetical protein
VDRLVLAIGVVVWPGTAPNAFYRETTTSAIQSLSGDVAALIMPPPPPVRHRQSDAHAPAAAAASSGVWVCGCSASQLHMDMHVP